MWGGIISGLITAGTSLFAGNRARKDERRREQLALSQRDWEADREDTQIQRMVADAKAAGINPLTAIRAGHSAGYAQTHMPTLSRTAMANALGNVGVGVGHAFQAAFDHEPVDNERAHLELEIQRARLRNINADTARMIGDDNTAAAPSNAVHRPTIGVGRNLATQPEIGRRTSTNAGATGSGWEPRPGLVDTQVVEDAYGELVAWPYGVTRAAIDYHYNVSRRNSRGGNDSVLGFLGTPIRLPSLNDLWRANERARFNTRFNRAYAQ